jgi:hypothetical protein
MAYSRLLPLLGTTTGIALFFCAGSWRPELVPVWYSGHSLFGAWFLVAGVIAAVVSPPQQNSPPGPDLGILLLFVATVLLHVASAITLLRDPMRSPGGFRGPRSLEIAVSLGALALPYTSWFLLGRFLLRAVRGYRQFSRAPNYLLHLAPLAYAWWMAPWIMDVIWD